MPRKPKPGPTESPLPDVPDEPKADTPTSVATIEPPRAPKKAPEPSRFVVEEVKRERRLAEAREELSFRRHRLLQEGGDLSPDEYALLKTALPRRPDLDRGAWNQGWTRFLRHEDSRVQQVLTLQEAAGTPTDRTTADKLAVATAADSDLKIPTLEEEIRELQNQVGALRRAATSAKEAADARHAAVVGLCTKELLPSYILDEIDAHHHRSTIDFGRALQVLEGRQISLTSLLGLDTETPQGRAVVKGHVGGLARFGVDDMERLRTAFQFSTERVPGGTSYRFGNLRPGVWGSCCDEFRVELTDVESRIAKIVGREQATAVNEVEKLKSFYVPV